MTNPHPITPPPELVQEWVSDHFGAYVAVNGFHKDLATRAAQWGADQELEACCEWLVSEGWFKYEHEAVADLRTARRPKPPSLKEQALKELAWVDEHLDMPLQNHCDAIHTIRRALEQLSDNE